MTNEKIGAFIAAMRKEKKLTQEQLAERLGVSNRSVSRWENGKTLPDLSLMQVICEELDITISELLNGEKETPDLGTKEAVALVAEMAQVEQARKEKELKDRLYLGQLLLTTVIIYDWMYFLGLLENEMRMSLRVTLILLGIGLQLTGILRSRRREALTDRELDVLSKETVKMTTAAEMIRFARKHRKPELKQHRQAFAAIADALEEGEAAEFAMTGSGYQWDGKPGPWHIALVLTNKRLLLCGESIRGRMLTDYTPEWLDREEIQSIEYKDRKMRIHGEKNVVNIEGSDLKPMAEKLKQLLET